VSEREWERYVIAKFINGEFNNVLFLISDCSKLIIIEIMKKRPMLVQKNGTNDLS